MCRLGGQLKKAAAVLSNLFNSEHVSTFAKSDKLSTSILVMVSSKYLVHLWLLLT